MIATLKRKVQIILLNFALQNAEKLIALVSGNKQFKSLLVLGKKLYLS